MTKIINSEIKKSTGILRALNHPLRQQIIADIYNASNNICVKDLCVKLRGFAKLPQPVVSQQLSILYDAKIVTRKRDGKYMNYSVNESEIYRLQDLCHQINNN